MIDEAIIEGERRGPQTTYLLQCFEASVPSPAVDFSWR